ncbi:hypothetical protein [Amycolatopsis halotolerans]
MLLVALSRAVLRRFRLVVSPDTVLRWHRAAGRLEVEHDDVGDFLGEFRVPADLEGALPVGLDSVVSPQFRHVAVRDGHALGAGEERGHFPRRPVRQARLDRRRGA